MDFDSGCTDQVISWKLKADYNVVFFLCNRKLPFRNCFMLAIFLHGWYDEEKRKRGMDMTMAERLQRLRKEYHFSQEQLAERLQVSRQAVSKWENGQTAPDLDNIIAMSNLYEVTTDYILIGKERVPKEKEQKRRKRKSGILCLAAGVILTLLLPLFAKLYQGWMFATEGSSYTNSLYYLTELPMLGVTVLAVAGIVIGIWLLKKE